MNINQACLKIRKINFTGNVNLIPANWYQHIKTDSGKTDSDAILILSDIVYWYTPTEIRDEHTGKTIGYKQKFKADKLQRSYADIEEQFGFTRMQAKRATDRLQKHGLITKEFRTIDYGGRKANNVLFIEPIPEAIEHITYDIPTDPSLQKSKDLLTNLSRPIDKKVKTNTYTTTYTTTGIHSKECIIASGDRCNKEKNNPSKPKQSNTLGQSTERGESKPIRRSCDILRKQSKGLHNKRYTKTVKTYRKCPKRIEPFMESWIRHTGRKFRGINKTYEESWKAIQQAILGKFFNSKNTPSVDEQYFGIKLTLDDWNHALKNFSLMRNNADYSPKNKKNIKALTPATFLYCPMLPSDLKSYFISCLGSEPKSCTPQIKDPNPEYTDYVIKACKNTFGWDLSNGGRPTAIKCAIKLSKFFESNKHRILMYHTQYKFVNQQVDTLLEMLEQNESNNYPAKPIYLYGDLTYNKLLPQYLKYVGSLEGEA